MARIDIAVTHHQVLMTVLLEYIGVMMLTCTCAKSVLIK